MLFLKQQLRTCLDLLRPNVQVTVENKQAQQKKNRDVHTEQSELSIATSLMIKNFMSNAKNGFLELL